MVLLVLPFLFEALAEPMALDRHEFLLGSSATFLEGENYDYLSITFPPIILVYSKDFRSYHRFLTLTMKRNMLDDPIATAMTKKLSGLWLCVPFELLPINDKKPLRSDRPYLVAFSGDILTIDYGFFQQKTAYRSARFGPLLKISTEFHTERDRRASAKYGHMISRYFLPLGQLLICWEPTDSRLGKFSILAHYKAK